MHPMRVAPQSNVYWCENFGLPVGLELTRCSALGGDTVLQRWACVWTPRMTEKLPSPEVETDDFLGNTVREG